MKREQTVLVTGGAGYVGSVLVPKLLEAGHRVKVLDLYLYGTHVLDAVKDNPELRADQGRYPRPGVTEAASEWLRQRDPPGLHLERPQL